MKVITIDFFGKRETFYFNIKRLAELETLSGKTVMQMLGGGLMSLTDIINCFLIGLQHIDSRRDFDYYADAIQQGLEDEKYKLQDYIIAIQKALLASGVAGKSAYFKVFPEELTEEDKKDIKAEETQAKNL